MMNIAIIGGGASGMITAYLLDRQGHAVTVYERQPILGGHIRTLNKNIQGTAAASEPACAEVLETGVLEFPTAFTNFLRLMEDLEVPLQPVEVGSGIFFEDGRHFLSPGMIEHNFHGWQKWQEVIHTNSLYASSIGLWLKTHLVSQASLPGQALSAYLAADSPQATWIKLLTMYSYSMPYTAIADFPAELAILALRRYVFSDWVRIVGGVYSYIEKILERFTGEVVLKADIRAIQRTPDVVNIRGAIAGQPSFYHQFDRVILATPPDQVLQLLADPRPEEVRRFQAWRPNYATTILHRDDRHLYQPYGIQQGSEFDFFQMDASWGYNAHLNRLCGIDSPQAYSLAFNLQTAIVPQNILHVQQHHTPFYTVEALRHRGQVIATNGENRTYYVGAYLGDGLHEGAVTSAINVVQAIGQAKTDEPVPALQSQVGLLRH
jgi:predicted NAD/FAD-binding protein